MCNNQCDINTNTRYKLKVKRKKIQIVRTIIQALATFFIAYGSFIFGQRSTAILPVFQCVYIDSRTVDGICKTLIKPWNHFENMTGTTAISLIIMLISIFLIGKVWCGYFCPFGFYQDILTIIRKKLKITPLVISEKIKPVIKLIKWGLLVCLMFGLGFCRLCPVKYIMMPLALNGQSSISIWGIIIAGIVTGICFLKESAFCEVCPLGTLMGLLNRFTGARIKKNGSACTHCRACLEVCPMGIEEVYQLRNQPDVTHSNCIFCMKCIEACPEKNALSFTLMGKPIITSKRGTEKDGK